MTAAPTKVEVAGTSAKSKAPITADHNSSTYRKGAKAEASTKLKDFRRQYKSRFAPPPKKAIKTSCAVDGGTHDRYAGYADISVVKKAV